MRLSALERVLAGSLLLLPLACGSRSELALANQVSSSGGSGGSTQVTGCTTDAQCPPPNACGSFVCKAQRCEFVPIVCNDGSPCTEDSCDPKTGCVFRPLSLDMDGDKHSSPRPGVSAETDVCGDDCDDTNPNVFPTNKEVCDGVDNDCDGVVDNGFSYQRSARDPVRVSLPSAKRSQRDDGGIAATPSSFLITYTSYEDRSLSHLQGLSPSGKFLFDTQVSEVNSNTYAGALAWTGQELATAWTDAHTSGEYDVYARLFSSAGDKRNAAVRLTDASSYSLHPSLKWNQAEYLAVFDDRRGPAPLDSGPPRIFGQRIAPDGSMLGGNVLLAGDDPTNEYPALALSEKRVGLAYVLTGAVDNRSHLGFRLFDAMLNPVGTKPNPVGNDVDTIALVSVENKFVALWDVSDGTTQGNAIEAAVFDENGMIKRSTQVASARFARSVAAMSLGDRFLMMWADDANTAPGVFELYFQVLNAELEVQTPRQRFTFSNTTSLAPALSAGPDGKIGVVFESWQDGSRQVYFSTLECAPTP